jgi:hypothetical protein
MCTLLLFPIGGLIFQFPQLCILRPRRFVAMADAPMGKVNIDVVNVCLAKTFHY